jgi:magnesium transporter
MVAPATLTNLFVGARGGISIPQVLYRFDLNPVVSSGTFARTDTDMVGHGSFLRIAVVWFGLE